MLSCDLVLLQYEPVGSRRCISECNHHERPSFDHLVILGACRSQGILPLSILCRCSGLGRTSCHRFCLPDYDSISPWGTLPQSTLCGCGCLGRMHFHRFCLPDNESISPKRSAFHGTNCKLLLTLYRCHTFN